MDRVLTTRLSSKGQVVIPEDIRNKMGLHLGDQFLVLADKDVVILKAISMPNIDDYKNLISKARKSAKQSGLTKESLKSIIQNARKK
ncbi:MAG: transcriptional regulator, AbrB family [Burkholderiales bacterium]|jgi:AbrB family looped-hinge helix DNA binding protein|nr:transcriptional regulator, AbrB family [Burkholderiales bacterium]